MLKKIKSFTKTTLLGRTLIVLPIVILILVFSWLYKFISDKLKPITNVVAPTKGLQEYFAFLARQKTQ